MKQNSEKQGGFTLMELLVVITIMALLLTVTMVDLAGQRSKRNLKIALSGLTSSIREIQNYTFSGRNSEADSQPVQYYIIKLDAASSERSYVLQALYRDSSNTWRIKDIETVKLPKGIRFASVKPIAIDRPISPAEQTPSCALAAFKLPFGKVLFSPGCSSSPWSGSDYEDLVNYITNVDLSFDPSGNPVSSDSVMIVKLTDDTGTLSGTVTINGITGLITSP